MEKQAFDWLKLIKNITRRGQHEQEYEDAEGWDEVRAAIPLTRDYLAFLEYLPKSSKITNIRTGLGITQLLGDFVRREANSENIYDALTHFVTEDISDTDADKYKKTENVFSKLPGFQQGKDMDDLAQRFFNPYSNKVDSAVHRVGNFFYENFNPLAYHNRSRLSNLNTPTNSIYRDFYAFKPESIIEEPPKVETAHIPNNNQASVLKGELTKKQLKQVQKLKQKGQIEQANHTADAFKSQNGQRLPQNMTPKREAGLYRTDANGNTIRGKAALNYGKAPVASRGARLMSGLKKAPSFAWKAIKGTPGFLVSPVVGRGLGAIGGGAQGYSGFNTARDAWRNGDTENFITGSIDGTLGLGTAAGTLLKGVSKMGPAFYASMINDAVRFQNERYGKPLANYQLNNYLNNRVAAGNYTNMGVLEGLQLGANYINDEINGILQGTKEDLLVNIPNWAYNKAKNSLKAKTPIGYANQQLNKNIEENYKNSDGSYKELGVLDQAGMVGQHMFDTAYAGVSNAGGWIGNKLYDGYEGTANLFNKAKTNISNWWNKKGDYIPDSIKQEQFKAAIRHVLRKRSFNS